MEEHQLGVGSDLSGKVDFVPGDQPCNVQRDRNYDHEEYDAFGSSNMNDMTNVLRAVMKPEAHRNVISSALQFALRYHAPTSKKQSEAVAREIPMRAGQRTRCAST